MPPSIPPDAYVMIIGAMKAGTSSLFRLLQAHPSICPAQSKEPEFFSQRQGHAFRVQRYEDLFDVDHSVHRLCLEASTGYTKYPEEVGVPRRIKEYGLNPRFIYLVRNPVARIVSHLNYAHINNYEWASDHLFGLYAVTFSMYYTQLSEYLDTFPNRDQYYIADFDDLKNDPRQLTSTIYQWLGLESMGVEISPPANVTPPRSKAELALVRSPLHRFRKAIPSGVRDHLKAMLRSHSDSAKIDLSDVDEEHLREWLHNDMIAFGKAFDFPVEKWGFSA